jgi:hypothetical protein
MFSIIALKKQRNPQPKTADFLCLFITVYVHKTSILTIQPFHDTKLHTYFELTKLLRHFFQSILHFLFFILHNILIIKCLSDVLVIGKCFLYKINYNFR